MSCIRASCFSGRRGEIGMKPVGEKLREVGDVRAGLLNVPVGDDVHAIILHGRDFRKPLKRAMRLLQDLLACIRQENKDHLGVQRAKHFGVDRRIGIAQA